MDTTPPVDLFAPVPPAAPLPPESGLAEAVNPFPVRSMDPELEEEYVAVMEDPLAAVVNRSRVAEPTDAQMQTYIEVEKAEPLASTAAIPAVVSERKRARRFHADVPLVMGLLLFLITAIAAASFFVSFSGLYAAAAWAVGDQPALQFAVPVMLDASVIAYSLSLFIKRERGEAVWGTWLAIGIFASISALANVLHTLGVSTSTTQAELIIGSIISGGAPALLAFTTETIAKLVFSPVKK